MSVAIVKVGVGNTASVAFALERLGASATITDDPRAIADAERVILPGVGAAAHAMSRIDASGLRAVLRDFSRPLLGVCLGLQLLYETSEEGDAAGLALLPGAVRALPASTQAPSPHMGWSRLARVREDALMEGVAEGAYAYFVHSYVCPIGAATIAAATYGAPFTAMAQHGNVFGCQFHPERSGAVGARVLANFLALPC
ncbi:MAG: imidazole glycerol phosphate synthase subunit HisH [Alphaproteobacteria bacterium]|nr:imidazole glycerol phosphate synthase subunit HisH [Alphaproteobacteria bacterium]